MISRRLMLTGTAGLIALATARLEALTLITARSGRMEIKRNDSQPSGRVFQWDRAD